MWSIYHTQRTAKLSSELSLFPELEVLTEDKVDVTYVYRSLAFPALLAITSSRDKNSWGPPEMRVGNISAGRLEERWSPNNLDLLRIKLPLTQKGKLGKSRQDNAEQR